MRSNALTPLRAPDALASRRAPDVLEPSEPPAPWRRAAFLAGGALIAAGWTEQEHILLVSRDGHCVATPAGVRLPRARLPAGPEPLSRDFRSFALPGEAHPVPLFGLCSGDGSWATADGWSVDVVFPQWPRRWVLLRRPPVPSIRGRLEGATRLALEGLSEHDWLKAGFSPSGAHLMVFSTSGCLVLSRG